MIPKDYWKESYALKRESAELLIDKFKSINPSVYTLTKEEIDAYLYVCNQVLLDLFKLDARKMMDGFLFSIHKVSRGRYFTKPFADSGFKRISHEHLAWLVYEAIRTDDLSMTNLRIKRNVAKTLFRADSVIIRKVLEKIEEGPIQTYKPSKSVTEREYVNKDLTMFGTSIYQDFVRFYYIFIKTILSTSCTEYEGNPENPDALLDLNTSVVTGTRLYSKFTFSTTFGLIAFLLFIDLENSLNTLYQIYTSGVTLRLISDNSSIVKRLMGSEFQADLDAQIRYPEILKYKDFNVMFCSMVNFWRELLSDKAMEHLNSVNVPKGKRMISANSKIMQIFASKMDDKDNYLEILIPTLREIQTIMKCEFEEIDFKIPIFEQTLDITSETNVEEDLPSQTTYIHKDIVMSDEESPVQSDKESTLSQSEIEIIEELTVGPQIPALVAIKQKENVEEVPSKKSSDSGTRLLQSFFEGEIHLGSSSKKTDNKDNKTTTTSSVIESSTVHTEISSKTTGDVTTTEVLVEQTVHEKELHGTKVLTTENVIVQQTQESQDKSQTGLNDGVTSKNVEVTPKETSKKSSTDVAFKKTSDETSKEPLKEVSKESTKKISKEMTKELSAELEVDQSKVPTDANKVIPADVPSLSTLPLEDIPSSIEKADTAQATDTSVGRIPLHSSSTLNLSTNLSQVSSLSIDDEITDLRNKLNALEALKTA
uniref:NIT domain-containing protein n=1 Tax=Strongyloides papillosus TaxID=174720 RepID=A0A0N5BLM6_STREA